MKVKNYGSKAINLEDLHADCWDHFFKQENIMNETPNVSNSFFSLIIKNKTFAAFLVGLGFLAGAGTTSIVLNNPFGPPTYSLCEKAGFPLVCRIGTECFPGETQLATGLTYEECQQMGGS